MKNIKFRTPEQVFKKWLKALRSGKYQQATGLLREVEDYDYDFETDTAASTRVLGFCCLGVLCDIAVKDGGAEWNKPFGPQDLADIPPKVITDYIGLDRQMIDHLIEMNDDDGATFEEIADEIESNIMPALGYM